MINSILGTRNLPLLNLESLLSQENKSLESKDKVGRKGITILYKEKIKMKDQKEEMLQEEIEVLSEVEEQPN